MLRWLMIQPNVQMLLGNHEGMLLACSFLFRTITEESIQDLDDLQLRSLSHWMRNGAKPTIESLQALGRKDPEAQADILDYLRDLPLYESVSTGNKDYLLVHAGLGGFRKDRPLSSYAADELIWHRPSPDEEYYDDILTILGHTPTRYYGTDGEIFCTRTWIDIDAGASYGNPPILLRLDDLQSFRAPF
jgi:serine/threonine protein phosphatase 1